MKHYLTLIIAASLFSSCSKWLDVQPQSEVSQDVLFTTEEGFQEALNGVYSRCARGDSYGRELTCGFLDVLAQNYTINIADPFAYKQTSLFNYRDIGFVSKKDSAWKALYAGIANCNIILEQIDNRKSLFRGTHYELIKGEALALRAYLHFDALRMFAPSFTTGSNEKGIPYVTSFTNKITRMNTVSEALDSMLNDLERAKELLKVSDPILSAGYKVGYPIADSSTEMSGELFLQHRRHRLNYYAVCGEMARVYLYRNGKEQALANALEVINAQKFPWTRQNDFLNSDEELKDRILYKELLFGWYVPNNSEEIDRRFRNGDQGLFIKTNEGQILYETAGVGGDDLRYKQWFTERPDALGTHLQLEKYARDPDANLHYQMAPAIRLSEMYYIAAECTYDSDPVTAAGYFDMVRLNRGIGTPMATGLSKEAFLAELVKECRKEFYGEGQLFYMYKRLNRGIIGQSGITYPAGNNIFVLPLPDDEIEFGNR